MRKLCLSTVILLLYAHFTHAQFYKTILPSPAFSDSLNHLVSSFHNNYYLIQGEAVSAEDNVDVYTSTSKIPGAYACFIYRFHSVLDTSASLQAIMYKGDNFKEASRIYRNTFRLVNKTKLKLSTASADFYGKLEEPNESVRFASSILRTTSGDRAYKHFVAEVELVNNFMEWEVRLNLHSKKDDKERYMD